MTTTEEQATVTCGDDVQSEIESVEVAVLLSVIFDGLSQMRPDLQMILDGRGIDRQKFSRDVRELVAVMITHPEADWEKAAAVST